MLLSRSLTQRLRRPTLGQALLLLGALLLLDSFIIFFHRATPAPPARSSSTRGLSSYQSVFIASIHRDTAPLLHRAWSDALVRLAADRLGPENVFVSLVESDSHDATRHELHQLAERLRARRVPVSLHHGRPGWELEAALRRDRPRRGEEAPPGWAWYRNGSWPGSWPEMRRVPHLVEDRNRALEPLEALAEHGKTFDRVLWIDGDAVFGAQDAIDVLDTRDGEYAAACSLDTGRGSRLQDTEALRDDQGRPPPSSFWPWFLSPAAVSAVRAGHPTRVYSCWNGIVAFQAAPFYADPPLRFRAVPDDLAQRHVDASERCLVHADNPMSTSHGVWLNPRARVARGKYARAVRYTSWSSDGAAAAVAGRYPGWAGALLGVWVHRFARWTGVEQSIMSGEAVVRSRVRDWSVENPELEGHDVNAGMPCLMDNMQVLRKEGWADI
jgi:hypothetical protein